jgi:hypothetical protein
VSGVCECWEGGFQYSSPHCVGLEGAIVCDCMAWAAVVVRTCMWISGEVLIVQKPCVMCFTLGSQSAFAAESCEERSLTDRVTGLDTVRCWHKRVSVFLVRSHHTV